MLIVTGSSEPPARIAAFPRQQSLLSDLSQTVSSQDSVREAPLLTLWGRTHQSAQILIRMAPERCIPRHIQCINRLIFFLQPPLKCLLAERAMAFSTQFIRNVPHFYRRVLSKLLAQQAINFPHLFPVNRRSITVIMRPPNRFFVRSAFTRSTSGYLSASHFGRAADGVERITEISFLYS